MKENLFKLFLIVGLIMLIPRFFVKYDAQVFIKKPDQDTLSFGILNLINNKSYMELVRSSQSGVICDYLEPTGGTLPELLKLHNCPISHLFLTEAREFELSKWQDQFDNVHRIVGDNLTELNDTCSDVNLLIFDVQGFGLRVDRATRLLRSVMDLSATIDVKLMVLDLPNPLGGKVEGPGDLPLRPGVTLGELARYWNDKLFHGAVSLTVVPITGWKRNFVETGLQRGVRNIGLQAPIAGFLEPFCHVKPFSMFLDKTDFLRCPALLMANSNRLSGWELSYLKDLLAANGVVSALHVAKINGAGEIISGLKINSVENHDDVDSFGAFMKVMRFFANRKTVSVGYDNDFDEIMGNSLVRETLIGKKKFNILRLEIEKTQTKFLRDIGQYLLYDPAPYPGLTNIVQSRVES